MRLFSLSSFNACPLYLSKMPLIEELPVTTTARASHGWTYIADTAAPLPTVQVGSRKRGRDGTTATTQFQHKLSAKQEKAIQQRLNDLGKENYREVNIPVPKRDGARGKDRKSTPNVRRILAYSRTFQHYLADEEAGVNVYGSAGNVAPGAATTPGVQAQTGKTADARRRGNEAPAARKGGARGRPGSSRLSWTTAKATPTPVKAEKTSSPPAADVVDDTADAPAPPSTTSHSQPSSPTTAHKSPRQKPPTASPSSQPKDPPPAPYDPAFDHDPLLLTRDVPKMPSARVMQALLAEPPLSYTAARAKPLDTSAPGGVRVGTNVLVARPQRHFCAVCGYWGKVRCKYGCGERTCGLLECWRGHEGVCSLAAAGY